MIEGGGAAAVAVAVGAETADTTVLGRDRVEMTGGTNIGTGIERGITTGEETTEIIERETEKGTLIETSLETEILEIETGETIGTDRKSVGCQRLGALRATGSAGAETLIGAGADSAIYVKQPRRQPPTQATLLTTNNLSIQLIMTLQPTQRRTLSLIQRKTGHNNEKSVLQHASEIHKRIKRSCLRFFFLRKTWNARNTHGRIAHQSINCTCGVNHSRVVTTPTQTTNPMKRKCN